MTMTDPVADMLTRIRNANTAMHDDVAMPSSKLKESLATLLPKEGYINAFNGAENEEAPGKISPLGCDVRKCHEISDTMAMGMMMRRRRMKRKRPKMMLPFSSQSPE